MLIDKAIRPATLRSYVDNDLIPFVAYIKEEKNREYTGEFSRQEVEDYKIYLINKQYKPATFNKKMNSLYVYNRWLIEKNIMKEYAVTLKDRIAKTKITIETKNNNQN